MQQCRVRPSRTQPGSANAEDKPRDSSCPSQSEDESRESLQTLTANTAG